MPQQIIRRRPAPTVRDPLNARAYRTNKPENPNDFYQPLYDCVNFSATAGTTTEISFFSVVRGQSATLIRAGATGTFSKTYRDTNMDQPNVISSKLLKVIGISLGFRHEDEGEVANVIDREMIRSGGYLEFRIIDRLIWVGPLMMIPEMNPMLGVSTTATATTAIVGAGGGGPGVPMMKLNIPVTINPNENFTVKAAFDLGASGIDLTKSIDLYCFLHAYTRTPG
jgi:hypothetical protein